MKLSNGYTYRPDSERMADVERKWRVKLPDEFRSLLMEYNGGIPEKREFQSGNRTRMIERFLCIKEKGTYEDYVWYDINVVITQTVYVFGEAFIQKIRDNISAFSLSEYDS